MTKRTAYWLDYLRSHSHITALLVGLAASIAVSMPWGGDAFLLGLLSVLALDTVAVAIVPSLPPFREWADRKERAAILVEVHNRLMEEINAHGGSTHVDSFSQMSKRVASLYRMADDPSSTLNHHDVQGLEDATMDYLRLCLSDAVLKAARRKGADSSSVIEDKLREVRDTLARGGFGAQEIQQLRRAESEFSEALARQGRMASRKAALEASLLAMPVRMEEVYQMVMTTPSAGNLGSLLEDSLSRLRITEEVSIELDQELGYTVPSMTAAPVAKVTSPQISPTAQTAQAAQTQRNKIASTTSRRS